MQAIHSGNSIPNPAYMRCACSGCTVINADPQHPCCVRVCCRNLIIQPRPFQNASVDYSFGTDYVRLAEPSGQLHTKYFDLKRLGWPVNYTGPASAMDAPLMLQYFKHAASYDRCVLTAVACGVRHSCIAACDPRPLLWDDRCLHPTVPGRIRHRH